MYPPRRLLFFSDWGDNAAVVRADMDGSDVRVVVSEVAAGGTGEDLAWINDLAVDAAAERIFWVDAHHDRVESADFDGGRRAVAVRGTVRHPFSMVSMRENGLATFRKKRRSNSSHNNSKNNNSSSSNSRHNNNSNSNNNNNNNSYFCSCKCNSRK